MASPILRLLVAALVLWGLAACRASAVGDLPSGHALADGQAVSVRFVGNQGISSERLAEVVQPDFEGIARRSSVRATIDDAAYSAEVHYRTQGYPDCRVDYTVEEHPDAPLVAVFQVAEGPRVRIGGVQFHGNASIPSKELEPFVLLPGRVLLPDPVQWYVAAQVEDSRSALEACYRSRGWLSARVQVLAPQEFAERWPASLELEFGIEEGPRYVLRALVIEGGQDALNAELDGAAYLQRPVSPRLAASLRSRLREVYAEHGHPDAEVEIVERTLDPSGHMDLRLRVQAGPPVSLGAIRIEGQQRTSAARIRNNLAIASGDAFDVREQRRTFDNLYRLGVFSTVAVELEGQGTTRDVLVRLEEAPGREFYFEPGYGSYEHLRMTVGWRELNLGGEARALNVEGLLSQKSWRATVGLTDSRFLDTDTVGNLTFFGGQREEPSFVTGNVGGLFTVSRELREHLNLGVGYQYRFSEVTSDDFTDPAVEAALENVNISSVLLVPNWDRRDNAFYPSAGEQARLTLSLADEAIGSQINFLRTDWYLAHFTAGANGLVLGLSWRGGVIAPFGDTTVIPIQERYFNGGENTVRSFSEDQLGPKDSDGNPVGGEAYNVFSVELRVPVSGRFHTALFFDTGNVVSQASQVLDFSDMGTAVGIGLRYALPVGPVRLDAGMNPDPQPGEADYAIYLSVGYSF